jgi:hypothetical protein
VLSVRGRLQGVRRWGFGARSGEKDRIFSAAWKKDRWVLKKVMYFESASGRAAGSSRASTPYAMNPKGVRVKAKAPMNGNTDFAFRDGFEVMTKLTEMGNDRFLAPGAGCPWYTSAWRRCYALPRT